MILVKNSQKVLFIAAYTFQTCKHLIRTELGMKQQRKIIFLLHYV